MSHEELESQLSAMFDDELPQAECELLARRLSRDPALKARWGRYALIAAAVRAEHGVRLDNRLAQRVAGALASEPLLAQDSRSVAARGPSRFGRWREAIGGVAVAAGVAALSIFWLRSQQLPDETMLADQGVGSVPPAGMVVSAEPDSYTVPTVIDSPSIVPTAELANYVVAHSEFSGPFVRRNTLSTLVASDAGAADDVLTDGSADAPQDR
jgi:sigma-E factor negative regulatory protein RseA